MPDNLGTITSQEFQQYRLFAHRLGVQRDAIYLLGLATITGSILTPVATTAQGSSMEQLGRFAVCSAITLFGAYRTFQAYREYQAVRSEIQGKEKNYTAP